MNPGAKGFLLLGCRLGDPLRNPLTAHQMHLLADRIAATGRNLSGGELEMEHLTALGLSRTLGEKILGLLRQEELLKAYLSRAARAGCKPITRADAAYPVILRRRLGLDSPGCLWARGDMSLLNTPAISLVGSRDLNYFNREFAREVGIQAAQQGLTLVSGNARGADREAQESCLAAGGHVISVVADDLSGYPLRERMLYLSEDDFDASFTAHRALSRNRVIHALGEFTFAAQCTLGKGGTWDGCCRNLRNGWSPLFCYQDGSAASLELEQMGASLISISDLRSFRELRDLQLNFLNDPV